jgi:glycosyltransferase involved in cell wall biosynthesis
MADSLKKKVAVIIPAFNEGRRIGKVLLAALESKLATEIIVVSDGSSDNTAEIAQKFKVKVINLTTNLGKGGAMAVGVASTDAQIVTFVDADLVGLRGEHIDTIIRPILGNQCDMCVGIFRGGKMWSDAAQWITPFLSGQRALKRELFESVPNIAEQRFGVETAITETAKRRRAKVKRVTLRGVSNSYKEKKMGLVKGLAARGKMYKEISQVMIKSRRRRPPRRQRKTWL